ncbi:hypothetical protein HYW87_03845 [Candidatus Roizmanbacteria bacterium]|nr:hypothetical protein [Candidatus Roizmanbacteria bacterium]
MYSFSLKKLPKNTLDVNVNLSNDTVAKEYKNTFQLLLKDLSVQGFRKGKVPPGVAEKHLPKETVYQELIRTLLPKIYQEIIKKENLQPVISPKIELVKAKEGEDWQIKITIALKPLVSLGNYKELIKNVKDTHKKADIWTPGKNEKEKQEKEAKDRQSLLNEILTTLLKEVSVEISDLILEEELNRRLARLVDDVEKIGLTTESYLKSKNTTMEELKSRYKNEIEESYKIEFILSELSEKEGIKVEQSDIEKLLSSIKDETERKKARDNSYFYAMILRKQKTLDYLLGL